MRVIDNIRPGIYQLPGKYKVAGTRLLPGANPLDTEEKEAAWEQAKDHPGVRARLESGELVEREIAPPKKKEAIKSESRFATIAEADAIALIEQVGDLELLKKWKKEAISKAVGKAVDAKIAALKEKPSSKFDKPKAPPATKPAAKTAKAPAKPKATKPKATKPKGS